MSRTENHSTRTRRPQRAAPPVPGMLDLLTILSVCLGVLTASGCESTTQVGSECPNGACPNAALLAQPCIVSSTEAEISVTRIAGRQVDPDLGSICLPRALPTDADGHVDCRVVFELAELPDGPFEDDNGDPVELAPPPDKCTDLPYALSAGAEFGDDACIVAQVSADGSDGDGWFYDASIADDCFNDGPGIRFTAGAAVPSGITVKLACATFDTSTTEGELTPADASACPNLPTGDPGDLGAACLPSAIPETGFDDREVYLEAGSDQCESRACLVYRLRGHPDCETPDAAPPGSGSVCASPQEVEERVYCSCRCDGPVGSGPYCACGDGFTCIPALAAGALSSVGDSYCVRNGTFTE